MIRRFQFRTDTGEVDFEIDCAPAVPELNAIFNAACIAFVQPYALAVQVGRLDEETAASALAKAYAEGVVVGSPSPELKDFGRAEWEYWLQQHPEKFATLRSVAEVRKNFEVFPEEEELDDGR